MKKLIQFSAIILLVGFITACQDNSPKLEIADVQLSYDFGEIGGTKFATVNSNKEFTAISDQSWCTTEIYTGGRTNNLRISTVQNENAVKRTAIITVSSEGLPATQITIIQNAATPYILVTEKTVSISDNNLEFTLEITSNILFSYELPDWIQAKSTNIPAIGKAVYSFNASPLVSGDRQGNVIIKVADAAIQVSPVSVSILQTNVVLPLLDEHFDWATSTSTDIFTSTNEIRLDSWPTLGKVWTSTTTAVYDVWTRSGYLKFCRGNTGADLVSPKLSGLTGTQDVVVTFKACGYLSGTGVKDKYHEFNISVLGGGTPSVTHFSIDNFPDTQAREHGAGWLWQNDPAAVYTFIITGATSNTQIVFLAGPSLGTLDGNSRLGLDDVKVVVK